MKETLKVILGLIVLVGALYLTGFIAVNLGIILPYQLWQAEHYGLAILQVLLVINYLFGGVRK